MNDLLELRRKLIEELTKILIAGINSEKEANYPTALGEICPPTEIVREAAEAATSVLIAFEVGYRIAIE